MMIVDEQFITWGVAVLPLLLALLTGWRPLRSSFRLWRRERLISGYGIKRLDNVILDDGLGGEKVIEHLLLTPDGLLVLLPRRCEGSLFGSEKIDNWTQMDGRGKSFHFENPLHQLEELLATVRYHLPGIPLQGRILFSGNCCFPKGRPERLLLLEELKLHEKRVEKAVLPVIDQAWQQLMQS
ncbi:MAG: NERD domain-containing protein, partial [Chromatiales bacterium]|nr:NERD domain-containing protein [Chromatiales bacterium]